MRSRNKVMREAFEKEIARLSEAMGLEVPDLAELASVGPPQADVVADFQQLSASSSAVDGDEAEALLFKESVDGLEDLIQSRNHDGDRQLRAGRSTSCFLIAKAKDDRHQIGVSRNSTRFF